MQLIFIYSFNLICAAGLAGIMEQQQKGVVFAFFPPQYHFETTIQKEILAGCKNWLSIYGNWPATLIMPPLKS